MNKKYLLAALGTSLALSTAHAGVVTFDNLAPSPFAPYMPLATHNNEFYQAGYWIDTLSNQAGATTDDLVGAIVDGSDLANTCFGVVCPTNNSTSFYTALNDGFLAVGAENGRPIRVNSFSASFVGAQGDVFPGVTMILRIQGNKVGGGSTVASYNLPGQANGVFSFNNYLATGAFANTDFSSIFIYGLACNAAGSCSAFSSDKGQFALDNLNLSTIPEPTSWALMALGLAGLGVTLRRRA